MLLAACVRHMHNAWKLDLAIAISTAWLHAWDKVLNTAIANSMPQKTMLPGAQGPTVGTAGKFLAARP